LPNSLYCLGEGRRRLESCRVSPCQHSQAVRVWLRGELIARCRYREWCPGQTRAEISENDGLFANSNFFLPVESSTKPRTFLGSLTDKASISGSKTEQLDTGHFFAAQRYGMLVIICLVSTLESHLTHDGRTTTCNNTAAGRARHPFFTCHLCYQSTNASTRIFGLSVLCNMTVSSHRDKIIFTKQV